MSRKSSRSHSPRDVCILSQPDPAGCFRRGFSLFPVILQRKTQERYVVHQNLRPRSVIKIESAIKGVTDHTAEPDLRRRLVVDSEHGLVIPIPNHISPQRLLMELILLAGEVAGN